ncbi:MAG TPA: hypothetical protein VD968_05440, partial [Pyrinomonadaceae bacterium]|nr:hypothetical protein [Pyrinomonadaceae bacterium]
MLQRFTTRCLLVLALALASLTAPRATSASASTRPAANSTNKSAASLRAKTRGRALWPGSRFTEADRARATRRGLRFIYSTALDEANFRIYGSDYLWCFYTVAESVRDAGVRAMARSMGAERARAWRRSHATLPEGADAQQVADFAFGGDAADSLGLRDERLKREVRRAAARFTARDFLLFDPLTEPPP